MNIAVVEDNKEDILKLKKLLKIYKENYSYALDIDFYLTGEQFLEMGIKKNYHLILMDIYMGEVDGIETAERLLKIKEDTLIAFLTISEEDIWRAVRTHGCFDYIRKSDLDEKRLEKLLADTMNKWSTQEKSLNFQSGRQEVRLRLSDIQYITSRDKYTVIVLKNGQERSYRITFSMLHNMIKDNTNFIFCNRGVLLNMDFIQSTDGESFKMQDGRSFPVRRKGRREIFEKFNDYQFEKLETQEVFE